MSIAWVDGVLGDFGEITDKPFREGEGLFETLLVRRGCALRMPRHLDRLYGSAATLGLDVPERRALEQACRAVPHANDADVGRMRIIVDRGRVTVRIAPFNGYDEALYEHGAKVVLAAAAGHPLGENAGTKVLPYAPLMKPRERALAEGAVDIIFKDEDGALLEGSSSNFFVVTGNIIRTPPLPRRILAGVTRAVTMSCARALGYDMREEDVFESELGAADEAFLTSSLKEVMPLSEVGPYRFAPGPVAKALLAALRESECGE